MAGTRLAAHLFFLVFSLISVLVAWRLGVVKRAPLPLKNMANPHRYPAGRQQQQQQPLAASTASSSSLLTPESRGPLPPPVDIDVVLLRSPRDGDCPSCAAALDAMQANPSLARNAFRAAEKEASAAATEQGAAAAAAAAAAAEPSLEGDGATSTAAVAVPFFVIREVNLRVIHGDAATPPSLAGGGDGGDGPAAAAAAAAALDDWLHRTHVLPATELSSTARGEPSSAGGGGSSSTAAAAANSSPRYTFFIACPGAGDAGELPIFTVGKHRHGYLGLGCACSASCEAGGGGGGGNSSGAAAVGGKSSRESSAGLASVAALAVFDALAGTIAAHVLRSSVKPGDVHVRQGQAYRLDFSLLSEDPALRRCTWDFAGASRRYLRPMLQKLDPVASFAVQSQEVQYARLSAGPPRLYHARNRWYYSPRDLEGFLGANDFSTLDLAAGWGPDEDGGRTAAADGGEMATATAAATVSTTSSPHSQVPVSFMVFCPSPETSPLVFMEEWVGAGGRNRPFAEAYEVPGFGGVSVVNGDNTGEDGDGGAVDVLEPDRLRRAFGAHVSQLRRIVGLPRPSDRPSEVPWPWLPRPTGASGSSESGLCGDSSCSAESLSREKFSKLRLTFLPSPTDGVTDWEVDALLRAGMARNRAAAAETLRSLAELVESQPEMEVSEKIAEDVAAAIAALVKSDASVSDAMKAAAAATTATAATGCVGSESVASSARRDEWAGAEAMHWAREALRRSEAAYFDPTMVPQLYFPQDHLMAVYFPFLAPLAFPLIFGFAQELLRYYRKKKKAKQRQGEAGDAGVDGSGSPGGAAVR
ncbi:unnamed protein product [Ectocarpus fasciculatus]